VHLVKVESS